jgi:uncharacterized protein
VNRFVSNLILGFFVVALMAVYGFAKQPTVYSMMTSKNQTTEQTENTRRVILPNGTTILAEVATTQEQQEQGLAGVEKLENNAGMLFAFSQDGAHSMWMKGMDTSIDMVWLNNEGQVVYLASKVPAPTEGQTEFLTYTNIEPARYVLELAAGTVESTDIKEGSKLVLS